MDADFWSKEVIKDIDSCVGAIKDMVFELQMQEMDFEEIE